MDTEKAWISVRQLSAGFGTMLTDNQGSQGHGSVNRRCSGPVVVILGQRERRLPRRRAGQRSGMARAFRRAFGEGRVPGRDASLPSEAYASLALVPTSLLLAWRHPRIWRWVFPWAMTLLVSTGVLWAYPFWHNYYLIHVALPMTALVAPTVALTGRALWGLQRTLDRQRNGEGRDAGTTGRSLLVQGLNVIPVACAMAGGVLVLAENLRTVGRTVNPQRDRDEQAMLEMLERHGSRIGTVFASSPDLTWFRSGALPVKGLELVVEKRRRCGDLSPESALAILQRTPPDAVLTYDLTDNSHASINTPFAGTNFLERHYEKVLENCAGHLWVRQR